MFNYSRKRGAALIVLLVLFLMFSLVGKGYCVDTTRLGNTNSSGLYRIAIDTDGIVTFQNDTAIKFPYQSGTTNDTLTVADSGRTYVVPSGATSAVVLKLPSATAGLSYPVISATTEEIYLNPDGTDIINYASLAAGFNIYNSSSAKGDSITLFCVTAGEWSVDIHNGTWADGGLIGDN